MVQRFHSDRDLCRPNAVSPVNITALSNDDSNRTRRVSVTQGAPETASTDSFQIIMSHYNIQDLTYRLHSGEVFQVTGTHPEPRQIHTEDPLTRRHLRSFVDAVGDCDDVDTASESGHVRRLPRAGHHSQASKRKKRGRGSPIPALPKRRRPAKSRQAAKDLEYDSGPDSNTEDEIDELQGTETTIEQVRIDELETFYDRAFRSIRQLACKDIVKAWICHCHPKKQTTHPYNGGKSEAETEMSLEKYGYAGHNSMPDYWPSDIGWRKPNVVGARHREPDHIHKDERLILMKHILRCENKGFIHGDFSLEKLRESTKGIEKKHEKHWLPGHIELLEEVYRVREKELKFERKEMDGDTLVTVAMPRPHCKVRKASNSAVKGTNPTLKQVKKEPALTKPATSNSPGANLCINLLIEDNADLSDGSEATVLADVSSSTEKVAPDASYPKTSSCRTRTLQHRLPSCDLPWPKDRRYQSVQENWKPQISNRSQDPSICTHSNPFGYAVTPGEGQKPLLLRGQCHFTSSSMQSYPSRRVVTPPNDQKSIVSRRIANQMQPTGTISPSLPLRPIAPKVEHVRYSAFASSSSGLAGAFFADADSSWQTEDPWSTHADPSMYMAVTDPSDSLLPSSSCSFSSGYSDTSFSSGPQLETWNDGNQILMQPYHQSLDEDLQQRFGLQTGEIPRYQHFAMNSGPPGGHPNSTNLSISPTHFYTHASSGTEHNFGSFSQDQRQS